LASAKADRDKQTSQKSPSVFVRIPLSQAGRKKALPEMIRQGLLCLKRIF
jgi:hypothetical protein